MNAKFTSTLLLAIAAAWCGSAMAAAPSAEVTLLTGKGTAASAVGNVRALAKGQGVYPGEVVSTGVNSYLNLRFSDGSYVLLRPKSRFQIEQYTFDAPPVPPPAKSEPKDAPAAAAPAERPAATAAAAPAGSRAFFRLLRGGFRAVSGLIGKGSAGDYRVSTPVATIGIRGTDYETFLCDRTCQSDPVIRDALARIVAGLPAPKLFHASLRQHPRGRFVKTQSGGDDVQVTFTHEGEVTVTDPNGKETTVPGGSGAVTNQDGSAPFTDKPDAMGDTPDPSACD